MTYHPKIIYQGPKTIEPIVANSLEEVAANFSLERPLTFSVGYREFPFLPRAFDPYFILSNGKSGRAEHDAEFDRLFSEYHTEKQRHRLGNSFYKETVYLIEKHVGPSTITRINTRFHTLFSGYPKLVDGNGSLLFLEDHFEDDVVDIKGDSLARQTDLRVMVGHNYQTPTQEVYIPIYIVLCLYAAKDKNLTLKHAKTEIDESKSADLFTNLVIHGTAHHEIHSTKAFQKIDHTIQELCASQGRLISKIITGEIRGDNDALLATKEGREFIALSEQEVQLAQHLFGKLHLDAVEEAAANVLSNVVHRHELNPKACEQAKFYMHKYLERQIPKKTPAEFCDIVKEVIEEAYVSKRDALEILKRRMKA